MLLMEFHSRPQNYLGPIVCPSVSSNTLCLNPLFFCLFICLSLITNFQLCQWLTFLPQWADWSSGCPHSPGRAPSIASRVGRSPAHQKSCCSCSTPAPQDPIAEASARAHWEEERTTQQLERETERDLGFQFLDSVLLWKYCM